MYPQYSKIPGGAKRQFAIVIGYHDLMSETAGGHLVPS